MSTSTYSVVGTIADPPIGNDATRMTILGNKTTTGFRFFTKNVGLFKDYAFDFTVHAS
jgi:hypothetical protein